MGGAHSKQREMKNAYKILIEKLKGKRPFGRHEHRVQNNIKMDFRKKNLRLRIGLISLGTGKGRELSLPR
jgi:hypothetical protein